LSDGLDGGQVRGAEQVTVHEVLHDPGAEQVGAADDRVA